MNVHISEDVNESHGHVRIRGGKKCKFSGNFAYDPKLKNADVLDWWDAN